MLWQMKMMRCVIVASIAVGLGPLATVWGDAVFIAVDMGTLGGTSCSGEEINNQGQVVGCSQNADGDPRAFLLTPEDNDGDGNPDTWFRDDEAPYGVNDLMIDLGILDNYSHSRGVDVNDSEQVVGVSSYRPPSDPYVYTRGFLWEDKNGNGQSDDGEMVDLGTLGGSDSDATSINNVGHVVGGAATPNDEYWRAFLWTPETGMLDLGTLGGLRSEANFISDTGQVVGSADDASGGRHAFLWTPDDPNGTSGTMIDLGTFGGPESRAYAMNDAGQIVGTADVSDDVSHAFLITPDNGTWYRDTNGDGINDLMRDLGTLRRFDNSSPSDINNAGQVIGSAWSWPKPWKPLTRAAFLWEENTGEMMDLQSLIDGDVSIGSIVNGINDLGQIVTGSHYILLPIVPSPPPVCGDGVCDPGEDECNCPADCGAPSTSETDCTDGVDNDCDGLVDCDDTDDCAGDPSCDCGARGDPCTVDSDCCSNDCKRNGTCR